MIDNCKLYIEDYANIIVKLKYKKRVCKKKWENKNYRERGWKLAKIIIKVGGLIKWVGCKKK